MKKLTIAALTLACVCALGQTPPVTPATSGQLPTYIMGGFSYNQYTGAAGFTSVVLPESNKAGLYGSATADLVPAKFTDPKTGKTGYLISGSMRAGQHKVVYNDGQNMLLIGGDAGASFANTGTPAAVTIGLAGSFTVTYVRQINSHLAVGVPVRMLYMSGVGPGGSGAFNPVVECGIIWKP